MRKKQDSHIALHRMAGFLTSDDEARVFRLQGGELKEMLAALRPRDRQRVMALLYTQYTAPELAAMTGRSEAYVQRCGRHHRDIQQAARLGRNMALTNLAERRAMEMLATLNPNNVPDEKKPRAARDLAEMADLTKKASAPEARAKDEDTMELVFRVRRRMGAAAGKTTASVDRAPAGLVVAGDGDDGQVIDAEFEEADGGDAGNGGKIG
jgi:hypothetical protein